MCCAWITTWKVHTAKPGALTGATVLEQAKARGVFTPSHQSCWDAARSARGAAMPDSRGTEAAERAR